MPRGSSRRRSSRSRKQSRRRRRRSGAKLDTGTFSLKAPFERMVREILESHIDDPRLSKEAALEIQHVAESRMVKLMKRANDIASKDRRTTVLKRDLIEAAGQDKMMRTTS